MAPDCKECHRKYMAQHYHSNKEEYVRRKKELSAQIRQMVLEAKSVPCMDCGVGYPYYVMDLDHRDPAQKLMNPSSLPLSGNIEKARLELAKCDAVCSNCHRERTHGKGKQCA